MKLYYHKTDGGAEYLMDNFILCDNGHKEGIFEGSTFIVRIDGNIEKDAEMTFSSEATDEIQKVVDYLYQDEQKHFEELDKPKEHIFHAIKAVKKLLKKVTK